MKNRYISVNGRIARATKALAKKLVCAKTSTNYWSSTEYNSNNAWNVNFNSGNVNNNNKFNSYRVRPVVALTEVYITGWIEAYIDCLRGKLSSKDCERFQLMDEYEIMAVAYEAATYNYHPRCAKAFVVTRPKLREVFAAAFIDRIVHHWICLRLEPLFEARFASQGDVSFNCRKGFGTLSAVKRFAADVDKHKDGWIGKFDISSCFMSIDKEILLNMLLPFIDEYYHGHDIIMEDGHTEHMDDKAILKNLVEVTVRHRPCQNCRKVGDTRLFDVIAPEKSMFHIPPEKGVPIGNLPSQLFVNFYLSFVDEEMNAACKKLCAGNVRFVDDDATVSDTLDGIRELRKVFGNTLAKYKLSLHPKKQYVHPAWQGVKFLGAVIKPNRTYLSNNIRGHMLDAVRETLSLCEEASQLRDKLFTRNGIAVMQELEHAECRINSYLGFAIHHASYKWRRKILDNEGFYKCFIICGRFSKVKRRRWCNLERRLAEFSITKPLETY